MMKVRDRNSDKSSDKKRQIDQDDLDTQNKALKKIIKALEVKEKKSNRKQNK